jgi:sulfoxide reductase heme-binding subunit YedZ
VAGVSDALWYFGRGSGVVSLVLLTIVVALGIGARSGRTPFGLPRFAVNLLHRNAALLAVVFLAGHIVSLFFDPYAQLRIFDLVLPFVGAYRPFWQGLGTLGFDLVLAIVVTSLLRHRIGARAWRVVHWLAYLSWPVALMHGLGNGSDNGTWWLWTIAMTCVAVVAASVVWRLSPSFGRFPARAERRIQPRLLEPRPLERVGETR